MYETCAVDSDHSVPRGLAAIVLESETVKVLTHSTIPVLVVRPKIDPLTFLKGS
jgi:hypothetical protein